MMFNNYAKNNLDTVHLQFANEADFGDFNTRGG